MAHLPFTRTKTIMKTTEGANFVNKEALLVTTRAAELLIKELALAGYENTNGGKKLNYDNLANVVHSNHRYEFLEYMIPKKITVKQYKETMRKKNAGNETSESESESSSDSQETEDDDSDCVEVPVSGPSSNGKMKTCDINLTA